MNKLLILLIFTSFNLLGATFNVSTTPELRQALVDAASNGQDDVIVIADGTYKTTDDGLGSFRFIDTESNMLTIKGSHQNNVTLSGENTDQILNLNSANTQTKFELISLSFINGSNSIGAGVFISGSRSTTNINNCIFLNN